MATCRCKRARWHQPHNLNFLAGDREDRHCERGTGEGSEGAAFEHARLRVGNHADVTYFATDGEQLSQVFFFNLEVDIGYEKIFVCRFVFHEFLSLSV